MNALLVEIFLVFYHSVQCFFYNPCLSFARTVPVRTQLYIQLVEAKQEIKEE